MIDIVVPVCGRDANLARRQWLHIWRISGSLPSDTGVFVVTDTQTDLGRLVPVIRLVCGGREPKVLRTPIGRNTWPHAPNQLFAQALKMLQKPWLWLEPDCAPLRPDWYATLCAEYPAGKIWGQKPRAANIQMVYGCAVYPPNLPSECAAQIESAESAFDCLLGKLFPDRIADSRRFFNIIPAYDQRDADGRAKPIPVLRDKISPDAVLFHADKEGILYRAEFDVVVQLGRTGDILNLFPIFRHRFQQTGQRTKVMVMPQYAPLFERITYAEPICWPGDIHQAQEAMAEAGKYGRAVNCMFFGNSPNRPFGENFLKDQWAMLDYDEWWAKLPLVFDKRSPESENHICRMHAPPGDYIVLCASGISSAAPNPDALRSIVRRLYQNIPVVDISDWYWPNFVDLLGLLENARLLITVDSAPLHLNRATKTPAVSFGREGWLNSGYVENVIGAFPHRVLQGWSPPQIIVKKSAELVIYACEPPEEVADSTPFRINLQRHPPKAPLRVLNGDIKPQSSKYASTRLVFLKILDAVRADRPQFFMVLEPDCRFKPAGWDAMLFADAMKRQPKFWWAGTPVSFNMRFAPPSIRIPAEILLAEYNFHTGSRIFDLTDEWINRNEFAFFPNGALSIYRTDVLLEAWGAVSDRIIPWDLAIGLAMLRLFGAQALGHFAPLYRCRSFNGDVFTESARERARLMNGEVVAIHPVKDTWLP